MTLELIPLDGLPEVRPGDDLAALLEPPLAAVPARDGDVVAVTQKIVSKAEGRLVPETERSSWIERESVGVVARRDDLVIVRTRHGFVCANAGVDASNVPAGFVTLLPEDPDASAERLQKELGARLGLSRFGVVISDTFGRAWREGVVDVAIGCAGLPPLLDLRGTLDDHGRELETTVVAFADAVASASGLVMTKAARVPAALIRGLDASLAAAPPGPARALVRAPNLDLFRASPLIAAANARPAAAFGPGEVSVDALEVAVRAASAGDGSMFVVLTSQAAGRRLRAAMGPARSTALEAARAAIVVSVPAGGGVTRAGSLRVGASVGTLAVALYAQGLAWSWDPDAAPDADRVRVAVGLDHGWLPVAVVAVGRPEEEPAGGA